MFRIRVQACRDGAGAKTDYGTVSAGSVKREHTAAPVGDVVAVVGERAHAVLELGQVGTYRVELRLGDEEVDLVYQDDRDGSAGCGYVRKGAVQGFGHGEDQRAASVRYTPRV